MSDGFVNTASVFKDVQIIHQIRDLKETKLKKLNENET